MTIYYVVPVPVSSKSISGGTKKLFDHVAILNANGIKAELFHHVPPRRIESGPGNLFVFPEVYGEDLIDALPPGVPRISMVQNGYLLDYDLMAAPKSPHPFLRCPDLVAVMVESQHTEDIVRARFPDLPCPIIRFTSSGNGRDGESSGLHFGPWPRRKVVTYFEYKRQELNRSLFTGMQLPPGWTLRPIANMTDVQVADTLRTSAIFAAPLTHEGLCATTQEAMIAGAIVVSWPGGPSRFVPTGWPTSSTPVALTKGNVTVGGPMEYLTGRAEIAAQDDVDALRDLICATARSIDADAAPWAAKAEEASRWHCEVGYSRQFEINELVGIMRELVTSKIGPVALTSGDPVEEVITVEPIDRVEALAALGRHSAAADALFEILAEQSGRGVEIGFLVDCLEASGRSLAEISRSIPADGWQPFLAAVLRGEDEVADRVLEALHLADPSSLGVLASASTLARRLPVARRLVWSSRLRTVGSGVPCPAILASIDTDQPLLERLVSAAAAWATFADPRARQAFAACLLELSADERAGIEEAIAGIAPDLGALVASLPPATAIAGDPIAPSGTKVLVVSRFSSGIRPSALATVLAGLGHEVVVVEPGPAELAQALLGPRGVIVHGWKEGRDWQQDCLALLVRHSAELPYDVVVVPADEAATLIAKLRHIAPEATFVIDVETGPALDLGADLLISSIELAGAKRVEASASTYLPERPRIANQHRFGVCIVGDTRDVPAQETEAYEAIAAAIASTCERASVAVIGDDPEARLSRTGWLRTGALADPTPWIAAARAVVVALGRGAQHWIDMAARCGTPVLVVTDDAAASGKVPGALAELLKSGALVERFSPPAVEASGPVADPFSAMTGRYGKRRAERLARPIRILADAAEVLSDERLLATYGAAFSESDDAALVIYGPGVDATTFEQELRHVATSCDFDLEAGPKVVALLPPVRTPGDEKRLAESATAWLTDGERDGAFEQLHRVGPGFPQTLRSLLDPPAAARAAKPPLVSVLIPVYNRVNYLRECVESVLAQTCGDFELVLVDDCSSDGSTELAKSLCENDERMRFVKNETNLGLVGNHRRCLELATGEFVKFVHVDDRLRPYALERLVAMALAHPDASLITSVRDVIDKDGKPRPPVNWTLPASTRDAVIDPTEVGDFLLTTGLNRVGEPSTVLFRRSAITPAEFSSYRGRTYTSLLDISTWLTLLSRGSLAYVAEPLSELRLHNGQYGIEIGNVVQHVEWLALIAAAHEDGFLADDAMFRGAIQTMGSRLVTCYVAQPDLDPDDVTAEIASALRLVTTPELATAEAA